MVIIKITIVILTLKYAFINNYKIRRINYGKYPRIKKRSIR